MALLHILVHPFLHHPFPCYWFILLSFLLFSEFCHHHHQH